MLVVRRHGARPVYAPGQRLPQAVDSAGAIGVYHDDGLGSVRALTDNTGAVVQTYETDEFGIPTSAGTQGTRQQPFGFTGEPRDPETGLQYLRARMYDPQVGRFLQRDPFGGLATLPASQQPYAYAHNNPVNLTDPSGECVGPLALACGAAVGIAAVAGPLAVRAGPVIQRLAPLLQRVNPTGQRLHGFAGLRSERIYGPPMDPGRFQRMKAAFERHGGIIDQSDDAVRYLDRVNAQALTWNERLIFMRSNPTASEVFEEFIHTGQFRGGLATSASRNAMEVDAAIKLIRNRHAYGISNIETRQTIARLRQLRAVEQ